MSQPGISRAERRLSARRAGRLRQLQQIETNVAARAFSQGVEDGQKAATVALVDDAMVDLLLTEQGLPLTIPNRRIVKTWVRSR